jgi:hypothetical protein
MFRSNWAICSGRVPLRFWGAAPLTVGAAALSIAALALVVASAKLQLVVL